MHSIRLAIKFIIGSLFFTLLLVSNYLFASDMQPVPSGGLVDYIITLKNNVPVTAYNPELNVTIPKGFSFVSINTHTCIHWEPLLGR